MIDVNQTWEYVTKSNDLGLEDCTVGNQYTIYTDYFNELSFNDDTGLMVCIDGREEEFLKHFKLVSDVGIAETFNSESEYKDAIFQQVSKNLYTVDVDAHKEFSPGSKVSQTMLDYYLTLHPYNVKINKLTQFSE